MWGWRRTTQRYSWSQVPESVAIAAAAELAACRVVLADLAARRRCMRLALNIRVEEVLMVLQEASDLAALASVGSTR